VTDEVTIQTETTTASPADTPVSDAQAAPAASPEAVQAEAPAAEEGTVLGDGEVTAVKEGEEPAAETKDQPAGAPEKYELALEGIDLDPELVAEAEPILRDLNLTNDQANALLPLAPKIMEKAQAALTQQLLDAGASQRKAWLDAFAADPDIGGAKREESTHLAAKGLDALGFRNTGFGEDGKSPHPFRAALNETGFGNHPDMIRAFRALGEMAGEDGLFARSNSGVREDVPAWKAMYPND